MGSGSSTQVKSVQNYSRPKSGKIKPNKIETRIEDFEATKNRKNEEITKSDASSKTSLANALSNVKKLEQLLAESESQRLDLEEKLETLEETIKTLSETSTSMSISEEVLKTKDSQIAQLEEMCQSLQQEITQLKQKHKQRTKKLSSQLILLKQEASIRHLEMKTESDKLLEENLKLQHKLQSYQKEGEPENDGIHRTDLIIDLSNQVSELSQQINNMEKAIQDKDGVIKRLEESQSAHSNMDNPTVASDSFSSHSEGMSSQKISSLSLEADFFSGPLIDKPLQKWPSDINENKDEVNPGKVEPYKSVSGVHKQNGVLIDLSDSDSEVSVDSSFSLSKIHSAPPMYFSERPGSGTSKKDKKKRLQKVKSLDNEAKCSTVEMLSRDTREKMLLDECLNNETSAALKSDLEPMNSMFAS